MKDYHLLLACDKYYLSYMFVACQSVLNGIKNSLKAQEQTSRRADERIIFNIIIDSSVDIENANKLASSFCKRNDFIYASFNFYNADENEFKEARGWGDHKTKSTFYRLLLDRFLPKDIHQILYIDIDVLVLGDVRELIDFPLQDKVLGTIYSHTFSRMDNKEGKVYLPPTNEHKDKPTVSILEEDYFNAGVLLINIEQWRKEKIDQTAIEFIKNYNPLVLDQDTLNAVTKNNLALDWSWNFQCWMFYIDKDNYTENSGYVRFDSDRERHKFKCRTLPINTVRKGLSGCNIVHFTYNKPWKEHSFIADEGRHFLFNEQIIQAIQMWQEVARNTPECIGVNIPNTTVDSVLGDIVNHTSTRLSKETKNSKRKRRELRTLCLSLIGVLALIQVGFMLLS